MFCLSPTLLSVIVSFVYVSGIDGQIHNPATGIPEISTGSSAPLIDSSLLPGSCDFETDVCGYKNDNNWAPRWERSNGAYIRGIDHDHTNRTGNFLYLKTSVIETAAGLNSGIDTPELSYHGEVCVLFYYIFAAQSFINILVVDPLKPAPEKVLVIVDEPADAWTQANVTAWVTANSTIKFQSQKTGFFDYVAIDDVQITAGNCSGKGDQPIVKQCVITPKIAQHTLIPSPTTTEELTEGSSQKPAKTAAKLSDAEEINNLSMDFEPAQTDRVSFYLSYSTIIIAVIACAVLAAATVAFSILLWHFKANRKGQKQVEEPKMDLHL